MNIRSILMLNIGVALFFGLSVQAATSQFSVTASSFSDYTINGELDPALTLVRGFTYRFNINASSHPFWINSTQGTGTGNAYNDGVTNNGENIGTVTFSVPHTAPNTLYYNCQFHALMTGTLNIVDPPAVEFIDAVIGSDALLIFTGSDDLDMKVQTTTNLLSGIWTDAEVTFNQFVNGTNTTTVTIPDGNAVFFRVAQGYF